MKLPVGLAYLLARTADTLADSWGGTTESRRLLLEEFRSALASSCVPDTFALPPPPERLPPAERRLVEAAPLTFRLLGALTPRMRTHVRRVVSTLIEGMVFDMTHFRDEAPTALRTCDELDRYTYLIAGVVGEFWTEVGVECGVWKRSERERVRELGIEFGKGLQLVNILRDLRGDFRRKRVYLPAEDLAAQGCTARDVGEPGKFETIRPLYERYLDLARSRLESGHRYVLSVPRIHYRMRLACIWPLWIGLATLRRLRSCPNVLSAPPVRIPQGETYRLLARSLLCAPSDKALTRTFESLR